MRADWFAADEGIFDFLRDIRQLTMDLIRSGTLAHSASRVRRFASKGASVSWLRRWRSRWRHRLLSPPPASLALNEVGGDPAAGALPVEAFHEAMKIRAAEWPHGMTATATHDTKRGEDARTRLIALAEIPGEWTSAVARWKILNAPHLVIEGQMRAPSASVRSTYCRTGAAGAWPVGAAGDEYRRRGCRPMR